MTEKAGEFDRLNELNAFISKKTGVKGLVDAEVTEVPQIFHVPSSALLNNSGLNLTVPTIDLEEIKNNNNDVTSARKDVVSKIKDAAEKWGFFQVINHGVPLTVLEEIKEGVRKFHEQDLEVKNQYIATGFNKRFSYNNSLSLYHSSPMNWRDTFSCYTCAEDPLKPEEIPITCRDAVMEYSKHVMKLGGLLFQLLSEALGLDSEILENMDCLKGLLMVCHYYPPCPQPDITLGTNRHTDNSFLTLLLQDQIGGLQVLHQDSWVDVPPVPGALVVNIGDYMKLITNDKFLSVEHRVRASRDGPRISVACFFNTSTYQNSTVYGPIKELLSDENPAKYKDITIPEYTAGYLANVGQGKSHLASYRI